MFLSTIAYAQSQAAPVQGPSMIENLAPLLIIVAIFYFFIIRPQAKRSREHQDFLAKMKRGDAVLTASGMYGKVEGITDKFVTLEISEGVNVRILKSQIAASVNEGASNA